MNFYQPDFLCHYKPLVLISGLANEESSLPDNPLERVLEQFIVDYPLINNSAGKDLANRFQSKCLPLKEWESSIANKRGGTSNEYLLNVRLIGRVCQSRDMDIFEACMNTIIFLTRQLECLP